MGREEIIVVILCVVSDIPGEEKYEPEAAIRVGSGKAEPTGVQACTFLKAN